MERIIDSGMTYKIFKPDKMHGYIGKIGYTCLGQEENHGINKAGASLPLHFNGAVRHIVGHKCHYDQKTLLNVEQPKSVFDLDSWR